MSDPMRVGTLNLCWTTSGEGRRHQRAAIEAEGFDLLLVQEARRSDLRALSDLFDWSVHSLGPGAHSGVLGVAILGRRPWKPLAAHQLAADQFGRASVEYPELGRWFHERHLAVDVEGDGRRLRLLSAHATPGTSQGPGPDKRGVGTLKPWFHSTLAHWIAGWEEPYLFAIDANTPAAETLESSRFHLPLGPGQDAGEDQLLGDSAARVHTARDLWRDWLAMPEGARDLAAVGADGPLAQSHRIGDAWYRYDHMWASPTVKLQEMRYRYDATVSDRALVAATVVP
jgi:hypothetical protein